jgi:hypothetical protein
MNDPQSRLERARFQYENLLLHAGNTLLTTTTPPRQFSNSPPRSQSKKVSPLEEFRKRSPFASMQNPPRFTSPSITRGLMKKMKFHVISLLII